MRQQLQQLKAVYTTATLQHVWQGLNNQQEADDISNLARVLKQLDSQHSPTAAAADLVADCLLHSRWVLK